MCSSSLELSELPGLLGFKGGSVRVDSKVSSSESLVGEDTLAGELGLGSHLAKEDIPFEAGAADVGAGGVTVEDGGVIVEGGGGVAERREPRGLPTEDIGMGVGGGGGISLGERGTGVGGGGGISAGLRGAEEMGAAGAGAGGVGRRVEACGAGGSRRGGGERSRRLEPTMDGGSPPVEVVRSSAEYFLRLSSNDTSFHEITPISAKRSNVARKS